VVPKLEYDEVDSGIRQVATRSENNVRVSDWTFPNHNHIVVPGLHREDPWTHTIPWMVAIDDEHCTRLTWQISFVQGQAREQIVEYLLSHGYETTERPNVYFGRHNYDPAQHHNELFYQRLCPEPLTSELTNAQDYVAQLGQGAIVDRTQERLGESDRGLAFLRSIFLRELRAIQDGKPSKEWRRA
jgi:5,5'-dehydrodivanillate O-demethylase oxygenase subunit